EIHTVIGAGAASGGVMDASNLIKPVLTNGEIRCIGSTTYNEYRGIFEKDHALARRFQKIDVVEPSVAETIDILFGLKPRFEEHHGITYADDALRAAAELAARHINERHLPDKAIDVVDEAGARSGLGEARKPVGSFLFAGPTGVGKTEVTRQLAIAMGVEFLRFDMSEYMERHTVSRLIGAPPGYVGFDQGGLLTEAITKHPH